MELRVNIHAELRARKTLVTTREIQWKDVKGLWRDLEEAKQAAGLESRFPGYP